MTGAELICAIRKLGRRRGVDVRLVTQRGKGSHGTLYYGDRKTIVKDRKKELSRGLRGHAPPARPRSTRLGRVRERMARTAETTLAWPAMLISDDEGRVQVRFPDFPEAMTDGADEAEALAEAADCLAEAVAARIADREDLPAPSPLRRSLHAIPLPPVLAYKAALFSAMRRDGVSKSELARRLGLDEKDVRRLLDPSYRGSKVERLHAALAACGIAAQITLVDATRRERLLGSAARPRQGTSGPATAVAIRRAG